MLNSATASSGLGQPVAMHLGAKALSVDADIATVTLSSGEIIQGDVVVGSDGFDVSFFILSRQVNQHG